MVKTNEKKAKQKQTQKNVICHMDQRVAFHIAIHILNPVFHILNPQCV